jgi:hypothetical protein
VPLMPGRSFSSTLLFRLWSAAIRKMRWTGCGKSFPKVVMR